MENVIAELKDQLRVVQKLFKSGQDASQPDFWLGTVYGLESALIILGVRWEELDAIKAEV